MQVWASSVITGKQHPVVSLPEAGGWGWGGLPFSILSQPLKCDLGRNFAALPLLCDLSLLYTRP